MAPVHNNDVMALSWVGLARSLAINAVAPALVVTEAFDICPESNGG
jgi:hypothetical protein